MAARLDKPFKRFGTLLLIFFVMLTSVSCTLKQVMRLGNISPETDVDTRLHEAAEAGDLLAVKSLLSQGCAINAIDICGRTPLHFAAGNNQLGMVEYLVSVGADVNGQADGEGWQDHAPL